MTPQIVAELSKKHGVNFLLVCAIFWMNNRLSDVESKLYDCLDDKGAYQGAQEKQAVFKQTYFVIPRETHYGKSKRKMERQNA
jgi:hypothetical protein